MNTSYPKEKIKILLLENISPQAIAVLQRSGYTNIETHKGALTEDTLIEKLHDVHILGIRSKSLITKAVLQAAPRLLAIGCFCIGTNQVDLQAATQHGVVVFNAPYSNTRSVAELVIGAAIMLMRRVPEKNHHMHGGKWMKDATHSHELRGKTLGIIGYGNIGSQVSVLAEAMGMRVVFYDVVKKLPLGNATAALSINDVVEQADVLSIHMPASKQNSNIIGADVFAKMKPGSVFINYARGELVDLAALKNVLDSGQLSGTALDVYPEEPESNGDAFDCALRSMPQVLLTPHIGGSTEEAQKNIGLDVGEKLVAFIETGATNGSHTVPQLSLPMQQQAHRVLHIHHNMPGVLSEINTTLAAHGINITGQYLATNNTIGYVVFDIDQALSAEAVALLREVKGTVKVRVIY